MSLKKELICKSLYMLNILNFHKCEEVFCKILVASSLVSRRGQEVHEYSPKSNQIHL